MVTEAAAAAEAAAAREEEGRKGERDRRWRYGIASTFGEYV